jgi:hypothetical protein
VPAQWDQSGSTPAGSPLSPDITGTLRMVTAGSLIVFLRRNIGIRLLSLWKIRNHVGIAYCPFPL